MFSIITDTSANLEDELLRKHSIGLIPFSFYVNGEEQTCTETESFDGKAFYDAMRRGTSVKTSLVTPQRYIDYMTPLLRDGQDILFISMSSGISGSFASSQIAAEQLRAEFPERQIFLVDTLGASLGEGLLVVDAIDCRSRGMSVAETAALISEKRHRMCQVFTVDNLKYLKATGRLSNIEAVVGTILHIKPILKGNKEGKIVSFAKMRGRQSAIQALAREYDEKVFEPEKQTVGIAHADCPEDAQFLIKLLNRSKPPRDIMTVCYEPVTGSHVGPGTLALFFFGGSVEVRE